MVLDKELQTESSSDSLCTPDQRRERSGVKGGDEELQPQTQDSVRHRTTQSLGPRPQPPTTPLDTIYSLLPISLFELWSYCPLPRLCSVKVSLSRVDLRTSLGPKCPSPV